MVELAAFWQAAAIGALCTFVLAAAVWLLSLLLRDVSIVDIAWSLLVMATPLAAVLVLRASGPRAALVLVLGVLWALRLALYILRRHWGQPEDRRYRAIRARNQPHFEWKSLYLVFGLQATLACVVAAPLLGALQGTAPWGALDAIGVTLFAVGFACESVADAQLLRFKSNPASAGRVMDGGLWRYTRHPNYFGEFCLWWGLWLLAASAGAWWTVVSPLLMSLLLLKVSGVTLLEQDIGQRRPAYRDYIARTNAFFPGRPAR